MQETIAEYTAPMEFSRAVRNITALINVSIQKNSESSKPEIEIIGSNVNLDNIRQS